MSSDKDYDWVCARAVDVPEKALAWVQPKLVDLLGLPVSQMFPEFTAKFPHTANAMEQHWPTPKLYGSNFMDDIQATIGMVRSDANLFFKCTLAVQDVTGSYFDSDVRMLPPQWVELYRWFYSFHITTSARWLLGWDNTPTSYSNRKAVPAFCQFRNLAGKVGKNWAAKNNFDEKKFKAWMWTDAGDALWLDEARCDHQVYHMRNNSFDDIVLLQNAEAVLDNYLAHIVAGGNPKDFDFRAPINKLVKA